VEEQGSFSLYFKVEYDTISNRTSRDKPCWGKQPTGATPPDAFYALVAIHKSQHIIHRASLVGRSRRSVVHQANRSSEAIRQPNRAPEAIRILLSLASVLIAVITTRTRKRTFSFRSSVMASTATVFPAGMRSTRSGVALAVQLKM
jgi:hypothetical protein